MKNVKHKIDDYTVKLFAPDKKGNRTRWGDKIIKLFSKGREIGQAVFAGEGEDIPEPYFAHDKIYFFASTHQYQAVIDLLAGEKPVYLIWEPVSDPKEPHDGDAYFST